MRIDIVLLPQKPISRKLGKVASSLHENMSMVFCVDNVKLFPHLSLYHLNLQAKSLHSLVEEIASIAQSSAPIEVTVAGKTIGKNWFSLDIDTPKDLEKLHKNVLETCTKFHNGIMQWPTPVKTALEMQNQKMYGVPNVLKNFSPHFTMGWTKHEQDLAAVEKVLAKADFGIIPMPTIAIAKVDRYCQVYEILQEFKLGASYQRSGSQSRRVAHAKRRLKL